MGSQRVGYDWATEPNWKSEFDMSSDLFIPRIIVKLGKNKCVLLQVRVGESYYSIILHQDQFKNF